MNTKEFEKQTLEQLLIDLKDIDNYKSFRKGAFVYDLGHYQGQLLLQEINRLNNIINGLEKKVEQLENIRKEAIEYINKNWGHWCSDHCKYATETIDILKGDNK